MRKKTFFNYNLVHEMLFLSSADNNEILQEVAELHVKKENRASLVHR